MRIQSARLAYAPFRRIPSGHIFIVFKFENGEEVAISPEADVKQGAPFSLLKGLRKTYSLRYVVNSPGLFFEQYRREGRIIHEYPLEFSNAEIEGLYGKMLQRAARLEERSEWYHTLFNSCITNTARHIDDVKAVRRSWLQQVLIAFAPVYVRNL
jgi:hypothetical protein